jgi:DNA ligase-1
MSLPLAHVVGTWRAVSATRSRTDKIERLAACLRSATPAEAAVAAAWLTGEPPQGRIGVGPAALQPAMHAEPAPVSSLTLAQVDAAFSALASVRGGGAAARRAQVLQDLFSRAVVEEQEFLAHLLMGELRQGALEGLMADAIARAAGVALPEVRRAITVAGNLPRVAEAALSGGVGALAEFGIRLFQPLQPMLAQTAEDTASALQQLGRAVFDYKLDGARIQVHRAGDDVRIYSRNLNDVTESLPEVVAAVRALPGREIILDGEVISLRPDGSPLPFQVTIRRFGRKLDVARLREEIPLRSFFFDCLALDGTTLMDQPATERFRALESTLPASLIVPRIITADAAAAETFLEAARAIGHEGIVAKSLQAPWDAGARGGAWLKIKPVHTLDLVVLAAEWGHGRRRGWLSNLHLGARDPAGGFVMLGKTFKGLTDEVLDWQTRALLARELARDACTIHVRPDLVVEIAFNDVQASPRYPGGLALRFARVKGYRPDKQAADADTIDTVRAIWQRQVAADRYGQ